MLKKKMIGVLLLVCMALSCTGCGASSADNHKLTFKEVVSKVTGVFAGDQTEQKNEQNLERMKEFQTALTTYMEDNMDACSDGGITIDGINKYLNSGNALIAGDVSTIGNSREVDAWWFNYKFEIVNNRDGKDTVGYGKDKAYIYIYSGGADGKYGSGDKSFDDWVLCVQYSDGTVYSHIYMPTDLELDAAGCSANNYTGVYNSSITAAAQAEKGSSSGKTGSRFG